jgi:hypothetical protein
MKCDMRLRERFWSAIATVVLLCVAVPAAIGAPITYVFSGPAAGTLGATPFSGQQVTVTATADTANIVVLAPGVFCVNLINAFINIAGVGSATITGPSTMGDNQGSTTWGFVNGTCAAPTATWLANTDPLAATYALATSIGPATGLQQSGGSIATTSGTLTIVRVPLTFQATLSTPVPTVSEWGLALLALMLGAAGFLVFRRRYR